MFDILWKMLRVGRVTRRDLFTLIPPDRAKLSLAVIGEQCTGCGHCGEVCPAGAISFSPHEGLSADRDGMLHLDRGNCIACGLCVEACETRLLHMVPKPLAPERDLMRFREGYQVIGGRIQRGMDEDDPRTDDLPFTPLAQRIKEKETLIHGSSGSVIVSEAGVEESSPGENAVGAGADETPEGVNGSKAGAYETSRGENAVGAGAEESSPGKNVIEAREAHLSDEGQSGGKASSAREHEIKDEEGHPRSESDQDEKEPQLLLLQQGKAETAAAIEEPLDDLGERLRLRIKEVLGSSLHIRHLDSGSCNGCDFELSALTNPIYDIQRFGIDFVASPRHADLIIVTGGVTRHLEQAVLDTFEAAAEPKMVMAIGACAIGGGLFGRSYAHKGGIEGILPTAVYVAGCPPRPVDILKGILIAIDRYEDQKEGKG